MDQELVPACQARCRWGKGCGAAFGLLVSYKQLVQRGIINRLVDLAGRDNTGSRSQTKERSQTDVDVTVKRLLRLA